jgi:hypothetical protein
MLDRLRPRAVQTAARCALAALALWSAPGCSTPTAAGCGVGVLAGVALSGIALASSQDPSLDAGPVLLGGSLFGLTSGCAAAGVSEAVARADERSKHVGAYADRDDTVRRHSSLEPRRSRTSTAPGLVFAQADLDGVKVSWLGLPQTDARKVGLRFQRYASQEAFASCNELELIMDGRSTRHGWVRKVKPAGPMVVVDMVQVEIDLDTVKTMRAAQSVEFRLCGVQRRLTVAAAQAADDFLHRFQALVPAQSAKPVPESAPPPLPEPQGDEIHYRAP